MKEGKLAVIALLLSVGSALKLSQVSDGTPAALIEERTDPAATLIEAGTAAAAPRIDHDTYADTFDPVAAQAFTGLDTDWSGTVTWAEYNPFLEAIYLDHKH